MSFSCPHLDPVTDRCDRVRDLCVCGRPGCVLARNSVFAIAPSIRLAELARQTTTPSTDHALPNRQDPRR